MICTVHRVTELCSVLSVMPEEVTYATLKFSSPKTKEPQESHSLKRMGKTLNEDQKDQRSGYSAMLVGSRVFNSRLLVPPEI